MIENPAPTICGGPGISYSNFAKIGQLNNKYKCVIDQELENAAA